MELYPFSLLFVVVAAGSFAGSFIAGYFGTALASRHARRAQRREERAMLAKLDQDTERFRRFPGDD